MATALHGAVSIVLPIAQPFRIGAFGGAQGEFGYDACGSVWSLWRVLGLFL